jgi:excisionase family DNA binding protein
MSKRKDILTTGQVAEICKVAPRTVSKWFDRGQLKGYRIPGSGDRRIPRAELLRFMKVHNIPTTALEAANIRVLIIDSDMEMAHAIVKALQSKADYQVETAENSFDAGVAAHKLNPHVILLNLLAEGIDATSLYKYIRGNDQLQSTKVVAVADPLSSTEVAALLKKGFDGFVPRNAEILQIVKAIEQATAIVY